MKVLILVVSVFITGCATVQEENVDYANKCEKEITDEKIIDCHWNAIRYKIRAKWWASMNGLTESDFPTIYEIKTKMLVDKQGNITDLQVLKKSSSRKLNRSAVKGIMRASPLPVPKEPYFTKGGFSVVHRTFVQDVGAHSAKKKE